MQGQAEPLNAIERVIGAVEALAMAEEPMRLSDIAELLCIPKSAVHRILASLEHRGWVEQDQNDCYALTLRMPMLGQRLLLHLGANDLRQPILDRLARRTMELVRLTQRRGDRLVWIGSARGRRQGLVYEADMTEPVVPFATANGKVFLASLPDNEAIRLAMAAGLGHRPDLPRAVTSAAALSAELAKTRERGYGLAIEEAEPGVAALAVAVAERDVLLGTMSVAAPIGRMGPQRIAELLPQLRRAAQSLALIWNRPGKAIA